MTMINMTITSIVVVEVHACRSVSQSHYTCHHPHMTAQHSTALLIINISSSPSYLSSDLIDGDGDYEEETVFFLISEVVSRFNTVNNVCELSKIFM
jgi:hypothetical protein